MSRPRRHQQAQMVICRHTVATRQRGRAINATMSSTGTRGTMRTTCHHLVWGLVFGLFMMLVPPNTPGSAAGLSAVGCKRGLAGLPRALWRSLAESLENLPQGQAHSGQDVA